MKININKIILDEINFKKNKEFIKNSEKFSVESTGQIGLPNNLDFTKDNYPNLLVQSIIRAYPRGLDKQFFNLELKYSILLDLIIDSQEKIDKADIVNELGKLIHYEVDKQINNIFDSSDIKEI